jgi:hypothetical protein
VTQSHGKSKAPTASRLEFKEMKTYGGMPMTDEVVIVTCVHCDKPMIPSAVKEHRSNLHFGVCGQRSFVVLKEIEMFT